MVTADGGVWWELRVVYGGGGGRCVVGAEGVE